MNDQITTPSNLHPTKVCAKCSVQTQTPGEFCPHCGSRYARRRRLGRKAIAGIVAGVLLVSALVAGVTLKARHDQAQERREAAAAAKQAAEEIATAKEAARQRRLDAKTAAEQAERRQRASLIR